MDGPLIDFVAERSKRQTAVNATRDDYLESVLSGVPKLTGVTDFQNQCVEVARQCAVDSNHAVNRAEDAAGAGDSLATQRAKWLHARDVAASGANEASYMYNHNAKIESVADVADLLEELTKRCQSKVAELRVSAP